MNTNKETSNNAHNAGNTLKCISRALVVNDKSVITEGQVIILMGDYDLVTFLPNYEIEMKRIRIINISQERNILIFMAIDLDSKQIIHLNRDVFNDINDWIITDLFLSPEEQVNDYCEKGR